MFKNNNNNNIFEKKSIERKECLKGVGWPKRSGLVKNYSKGEPGQKVVEWILRRGGKTCGLGWNYGFARKKGLVFCCKIYFMLFIRKPLIGDKRNAIWNHGFPMECRWQLWLFKEQAKTIFENIRERGGILIVVILNSRFCRLFHFSTL